MRDSTQLTLNTDEEVTIEDSRMNITVTIEAENDEILHHFSVADIVKHFDFSELLDEIGEASCRDHFGIDD